MKYCVIWVYIELCVIVCRLWRIYMCDCLLSLKNLQLSHFYIVLDVKAIAPLKLAVSHLQQALKEQDAKKVCIQYQFSLTSAETIHEFLVDQVQADILTMANWYIFLDTLELG